MSPIQGNVKGARSFFPPSGGWPCERVSFRGWHLVPKLLLPRIRPDLIPVKQALAAVFAFAVTALATTSSADEPHVRRLVLPAILTPEETGPCTGTPSQ